MSTYAGLDGQLGYKAESTWGTYVAPDRWLEFVTEGLEENQDRIESSAIRSGSRVLRSDRRKQNVKGASGAVQHEIAGNGFGLLFSHALGAVATSTPGGATLTRDHTCTLDDLLNKSLTIQKGVPDVGGTVRPFSYLGCKIIDWSLSNSVDGILLGDFSYDAQAEDTGQSLATVSYPTTQELLCWDGGQAQFAGADVDVKDITISAGNALKTDRYFLQNSALKKQQLRNGRPVISGTATLEFESMTEYNRFKNDTRVSFNVEWLAATLIEGAFYPKVRVEMSEVMFDGETPKVTSNDLIEYTMSWMALDDGTNEPITVIYRTTDTAP